MEGTSRPEAFGAGRAGARPAEAKADIEQTLSGHRADTEGASRSKACVAPAAEPAGRGKPHLDLRRHDKRMPGNHFIQEARAAFALAQDVERGHAVQLGVSAGVSLRQKERYWTKERKRHTNKEIYA